MRLRWMMMEWTTSPFDMKPTSIKYKATAGVKEQPMDHFTDVNRGLSAWLLRKDPAYLRASEMGKARNAAVKARRGYQQDTSREMSL